jgi:predicted  nucleic acid-binding Zn-ribbon protein
MKRTRLSAEQIVKKLHDAATAMAGGKTVREYKALNEENARLKRLVAELSLDNHALKELAEGKW